MRWFAFALLLVVGCVATTSVTRTGTGLSAPREDAAEEEEAPRGLDLSIASIASDGTVRLDLRNYSQETFVFAGTPQKPRLIIEIQSGDSRSRHTLSSFSKQTHEVPAGERVQLKADVAGATGRLRIGIRSQEFGYVLWSNWIAR